MMDLVDFVTAVEILKQFGEDFPKVILAYRDQSEGKKLNLRPDPVSYTHLDVYKRQGLRLLIIQQSAQ